MKTCEDFELLINLSLDGMLSDEEQRELRAHLQSCAACRETYRQLCGLKTTLAELEEPVPAELHARIMEAVNAESAPKVRKFPLRRVIRAAAAVAACAAIGVVALRFAPSMDVAAPENSADANVGMAAPGVAYDSVPELSDGKPALEPSQNTANPGFVVEQPSQMSPEPPELSMKENNGQIAEDLPPLRVDSTREDDFQNAGIRKWLKVTGYRKDMPEWVDWSSVYETELEGLNCEYLQIQSWAETVWLDYLITSGFTVETLEGTDLDPNGDCILLFFFLN